MRSSGGSILFASLDTDGDGGISEGAEFEAAFGSGPSPTIGRLLQLPDGWGDDEVYTWIVGREETDLIDIKRGPSYFSSSTRQTETSKIIDPRRSLRLRLPGLAALAAAQAPPADASAYHTPSFKMTVDACTCLELASTCENNDCTPLATIETDNAGGYQLSSCFTPEWDDPPQTWPEDLFNSDGTGGTIPGAKGNCLGPGYTDGVLEFLAYHDGFRVTLETRKTLSNSGEAEYESNAALPELGAVTSEDSEDDRRPETSPLLDVTYLRANSGAIRTLSSRNINSMYGAPWLPVVVDSTGEVLISGEEKSWSWSCALLVEALPSALDGALDFLKVSSSGMVRRASSAPTCARWCFSVNGCGAHACFSLRRRLSISWGRISHRSSYQRILAETEIYLWIIQS